MDLDLDADRRHPLHLRSSARITLVNRITFLLAVVGVIHLCGCAPDANESAVKTPSTTSVQDSSEFRNSSNDGMPVLSASSQSNKERLASLWTIRQQAASMTDYPIGPGDVLIINAAGIEELSNRTIRVTGDGFILLPLVGSVRAAGLTEEELKASLGTKLASYIKQPEITLFVQEYRSRQVGVFGAVAKPGVYSLSSGTDTISDMLSLAGGTTTDAARRIEFIPAKTVSSTGAPSLQPNAITPVSLSSKPDSANTNAVLIDLNNRDNRIYLGMPARPGDVIVIPASGEVLVEGWVGKAGSYPITPGLRVLGAIAAAGGLLFPADSSSITIIRTGRENEPIRLALDLDTIKEGHDLDLPVEEGDVVEVGASTAKLIPYGLYQGVVQMFRVGAYAF